MAKVNTSPAAMAAAASSIPKIFEELPAEKPTCVEEADDYMDKTISASEQHIRSSMNIRDSSSVPHIPANQRKQVKELAMAQARNPNKKMQKLQQLMGGNDDKEPPKPPPKIKGEGISQPKNINTDYTGMPLSTVITETKALPKDWTIGPVEDIDELHQFMETHYWVNWRVDYWTMIKQSDSYADLGLFFKGKLCGYAGTFIWNTEWTAERKQVKRAGFNWWVIAKQYRKRNLARLFLMHFLANLQTKHEIQTGYTLCNKETEQQGFMIPWFFRPLQTKYLIDQNWWVMHGQRPNRARLFYKVKPDSDYQVSRGATIDQVQRLSRLRIGPKKGSRTKARFNTLCPKNGEQWDEYQQIFEVLRVEYKGKLVAILGSLPFSRRQDEDKGWANTIIVSWIYTELNRPISIKDELVDVEAIVNACHAFWVEHGHAQFDKVAGVFWPAAGPFATEGGDQLLVNHNRCHIFDQSRPNFLVYWNTGLWAHPSGFHSPLWMQS